MIRAILFSLFLFSSPLAYAQTEILDNRSVMEMSKSGLSSEIILRKVASSRAQFDISVSALIELKKAGLDDNIITAMMERGETQPVPADGTAKSYPGSPGAIYSESPDLPDATERGASRRAKTISFGKSSIQPSRQALEKELLKRSDFRQLQLTILRYKEASDLFVDIGFVSGSVITHRYVYRIYDRRSGAVVAAGETTSWGSLAENLARHISKRLAVARAENAI